MHINDLTLALALTIPVIYWIQIFYKLITFALGVTFHKLAKTFVCAAAHNRGPPRGKLHGQKLCRCNSFLKTGCSNVVLVEATLFLGFNNIEQYS